MSSDVKVVLDTTNEVKKFLKRLVDTGLYGETVEQCAEQLLRERLRDLERDGLVR